METLAGLPAQPAAAGACTSPLPMPVLMQSVAPLMDDEDAAQVLAQWERSRARHSNAGGCRHLGLDGALAHEDAASDNSGSPARGPQRRNRRASSVEHFPGSLGGSLRDSPNVPQLPLLLAADKTPSPVGQRKTRRSSYSVGMPFESASLFGRTTPLAGSHDNKLTPLSKVNWLTPVEIPALELEHHSGSLFGQMRGGSTPNAGAAATHAAAANHSTAAEAKEGLGGKIKKLLKRTITRANVLQKSQPTDAHTASVAGPRSQTQETDGSARALDEPAPRASYSNDSDEFCDGSPRADLEGNSLEEARMFGLHGGAKNAVQQLLALLALAPFMPRMLVEEVVLDDARYHVFGQGGIRELVSACKGVKPSMHELQGAVMIADVKGFTQLTEILSKKGTAGVELLTYCMNDYFSKVIDTILAFEGDVIKFAGDSMIVLFSPSHAEQQAADKGLHAATMRCTKCAHVLATTLGHMRMKLDGKVEPIKVAAGFELADIEDGQGGTDLLRKQGTAVKRPRAVPASTSQLPDHRTMAGVVQHAAQQAAGGLPSGLCNSSSAGSLHNMTSAEIACNPADSLPEAGSGMFTNILQSLHPSETMSMDSPMQAMPPASSLSMIDCQGASTSTLAGPATPCAAAMLSSPGNPAPKKRASWLVDILMRNPRKSLANDGALTTSSSIASNQGSQVSAPDARSQASTSSAGGASNAAGLLVRARTRTRAEGRGTEKLADAALWGEGSGIARREMSLMSKLNMPPPVRANIATARTSVIGSPVTGSPYDSPHGLSSSHLRTGSFSNDQHGKHGALPARRPTESWALKFQNLQSGVVPQSMESLAAVEPSHGSLLRAQSKDPHSADMPDAPNINPLVSASSSSISQQLFGSLKRKHKHKHQVESCSAVPALSSMQLGGLLATQEPAENSPTSLIYASDSVPASPHPGQLSPSAAAAAADHMEWSEDSYTVGALASLHSSLVPSRLGASSSSLPRPIRTSSSGAASLTRPYTLPSPTVNNLHAHHRTPGPGPLGEGCEQQLPCGNTEQQQCEPVPLIHLTQHPLVMAVQQLAGTYCNPNTHIAKPSTWHNLSERCCQHQQSQLHKVLLKPAGPVAEGLLSRNVSLELYPLSSSSFATGVERPDGLGRGPSRTSKASFVNKVMNWLGTRTSVPRMFDPKSPDARGEDGEDGHLTSPSPTHNSFAYVSGLRPAGPGPTQLPGAKTRDPVMEEAMNSEFSLKIMISAGTVSIFQVGGYVDEVIDTAMPEVPRWEYFIGDRPLAPLRDQNNRRRCIAQIAQIEDHAGAGQVVCSQEVVDLLQDDWSIEMVADDVGRLQRPRQIFTTPPITQDTSRYWPRLQGSPHVVVPVLDDGTIAKVEKPHLNALTVQAQHRLANVLRMHVLGSVRTRVEAGHLDYINEIRPLTCMFLGFPSLLEERADVDEDVQVSAVQYCMEQTQQVMRRWDGSLLQFRCDEKGYVAICAFGLPGHTHEDNPSRGILAALDLQRRIREKSHQVSIGVTTGDLLCTCVGARLLRLEYTVFGDAINLSARLMVKCKKSGGEFDILCDEPTHACAKFKASFQELEPLTVKGKKLPVHVFHVKAFDKEAAAAAREAASDSANGRGTKGGHTAFGDVPERPLVGRDAELKHILDKAAEVTDGTVMGMGGVLVIEGNTGMGKTKLLMEVRHVLERKQAETTKDGQPVFHLLYGMADIANKNSKLYPWRRAFNELFAHDRLRSVQQQQEQPLCSTQDILSSTHSQRPCTLLGEQLSLSCQSHVPDWARMLSDLLEIPLALVPVGNMGSVGNNLDLPTQSFMSDGPAEARTLSLPLGQAALASSADTAPTPTIKIITAAEASGAGSGVSGMSPGGSALGSSSAALSLSPRKMLRRPMSVNSSNGAVANTAAINALAATGSVDAVSSGSSFVGRAIAGAMSNLNTLASSAAPTTPRGQIMGAFGSGGHLDELSGTLPSVPLGPPAPPAIPISRSRTKRLSSLGPPALPGMAAAPGMFQLLAQQHGTSATTYSNVAVTTPYGGSQPAAPWACDAYVKKAISTLAVVLNRFSELYGPIVIMLENLHEFDTWSWELLTKTAEVARSVLVIVTTRPHLDPGSMTLHKSKTPRHQMPYETLVKQPATQVVQLEPFGFLQTKALMQVVADNPYPEQYVLAVMEKTGGMPLYIEKVTEFLCQKPWLGEEGNEFTANVNKMIRSLNFQQVIMERMDRLKPGVHLTLKVASVMGQWVDLDILHKFYPINKTRDELRGHLMELARGNFLKATDTDGVWEFNMVERDIVYEVIPHYQRRRMHAKLAQELERSLEEQHVATLTTIAYHWHQACMGHEVTEVECALKAIEYWARAAEAGYSSSSLVEALRLYQKAAQIAEMLSDSVSDSFHDLSRHEPPALITSAEDALIRAGDSEGERRSGSSESGRQKGAPDSPTGGDEPEDKGSFTAVGAGFRGQLNWLLINRITRAQWEKSMASCCLGIVMQHRLEFAQLDVWDSEDYFTLLMEHAIRGLMLLGAPHPQDVLLERQRSYLQRLLCCSQPTQDVPSGWQEGVVLQDQEVTEIRDILLVLIIAAEHYSLQQDGEEYTRLLTFCKRVCEYFSKCSDTGLDPFHDIQLACSLRIKNYKTNRRGVASEFAIAPGGDGLLGLGNSYNSKLQLPSHFLLSHEETIESGAVLDIGPAMDTHMRRPAARLDELTIF